jgi:type II secretory pathway pseudopilin PulG
MAIVVTEIRKRRCVCGLFWQSLSNPRELRAEAVDLARKLNFDLLVLRKELGLAQAGYASSREGAQPGLLSLGAMVAAGVAARGVVQDGRRQPAASWLAAFRLDGERWAYFAVRDESFLPSGDFAGTQAEVLERLHADYAMGGWNAVLGDAVLAEQGFHNVEVVGLDELLPRAPGRWPWLPSAWELVPVQRSRRRAMALAGAAAAMLLLVAGAAWQRQRAADQELARLRALQTAQQRRVAELAQAVPPPPWPGKPAPRELARACAGGLAWFAPGGWRLDEYRCNGAQATHAWSRGDSTVSYLLEQVPAAAVDLDGEHARLAQPLTVDGGLAEELLPADELLRPLVSRFQQLGLRLQLKAPAAAAPAAPAASLPGVRQFVAPAPPWKTYTFSLQAGGLPLADVASVLSQPGVRLNTLAYRQGDWFLEGVAYAK